MSSTLRIDNGRVLTCADRTVIERGSVVTDGDRIAWVGPTAELPEEHRHSTNVVDAAGATVLPGLLDAHMHISFGEAASEEELSLHTPPAYRAIRAAVDAAKVLAAGVTTACDPGGPRGIATAVRDAIDAGLVIGPRFAAAGRQITTQQGIGDTLPAPLGDLPTAFGVVVRSHDDIVQEIRNEVKEGVDLVKIAGSGPGTEEHGAFTRAELDVAVAEAHRLGKPIAIHRAAAPRWPTPSPPASTGSCTCRSWTPPPSTRCSARHPDRPGDDAAGQLAGGRRRRDAAGDPRRDQA